MHLCVLQDTAGTYYPADTEHIQNFAYLIVDPVKRNAIVLYHKFGAAAFQWEKCLVCCIIFLLNKQVFMSALVAYTTASLSC